MSTLYSAHQKSRGFSLLEVMVAMSILSIAVVALFQLFSMNLRTVKKAEDYSRALIHARSLMDEALSFPKPPETSSTFKFDDGFRGTRTVNPKPSDDKITLHEIIVTVTWQPSGSLKLNGYKVYASKEE